MNPPVIIALFAALIALRAVFGVFQHLLSPLRTIQGPFLARLTNLWIYMSDMVRMVLDAIDKRKSQLQAKRLTVTGPIVRYGPNRYSISDLDSVKAIYGLGSSFPKSSWYTIWASPGQHYLLKNPSSMARLRQEVDELTSQGNRPQYTESQKMPYLQAVMKEALRLHPATGLPLERVAPKGGAAVCGKFFPEGTIVGINTWVARRDMHVFGHDSHEFLPERWLQQDSQKVALMNRFWMPFGPGSRTCIGRHISMLEICKLVPMLVRDFDFTLHDDLGGKDWSTQNYWFVKPVDFKVWLQPRKESS
ncbi:hypothetical protein F66182_868 [Fusarium sp. NRRL 66182]|nr:hypothetical protein F66182_868 [Fusarium sp. NRRL 66182]